MFTLHPKDQDMLMNGKLCLLVFFIGSVLSGCATGDIRLDENIKSSGPVAHDMMNILDDLTATRPYSRYLYKIVEKNGTEITSGMAVISQTADQGIRLDVAGSQLKVTVSEAFMQTWDLELGNAAYVPFGGGYVANGRLAIMPGLYTPVEFRPYWFPANAEVSVDNKCNFLVRMKTSHENETQKLVAFMDVRNKLDGARCEILGTFHTIPQLKKLVTDLRNQKKYHGKAHYILRLSWGPTFALVRIAREGER